MRPAALLIAAVLFLLPAGPSSALEKAAQPQPSKQPELRQIRPKKPVKIRLKRNAKDDYTWELSGDDADEVVRVDRRLRKLLNVQ